MTTALHRHFATRPVVAWLDRWPLPVVVATAVAIGCAVGGAGFFYLEAPAWALFWLVLFAALGWLGYTAAPVFDEPDPIEASTRVRQLRDGPLLMVDLPGGRFLMGSPDSDDMASKDEKPQHEVSVAPFRMAITPVTAGLYRELMMEPSTTETAGDARLPATGVSWLEAIEFCNRLSERSGYRPCYSRLFGRWRCDWRADGYRLPTEAEWEYACRAGTTTRYGFGDDAADLERYAWYESNAQNTLQPVATRRANAWGVYDMHGNVWEWCWDWYGSYSSRLARNPRGPSKFVGGRRWRVLRGGSFLFDPASLRSAGRLGDAEEGVRFRGFRCVRVPLQRLDPSTD